MALDKTGDRETAREMVQETFLSFYQHKNDIEPDTSIRAYLYVILKNKLLNSYRSVTMQRRYENYVSLQPSPASISPLAWLETRELEQLIAEEVERLPPQCRTVFKLSREKHLTDKEIAAELNISVNTVEQHKRVALKKLRLALGDLLEIALVMSLLNKL